MAPFYPDLGSGAVCEFCGASASGHGEPDRVMQEFAAKGWHFLPSTRVDESRVYLAACPNRSCRAELRKLEKAGQQ
jgi:hypothetical protein